LLKRRLAELSVGRFIPSEDKLTFEDMARDLVNDYEINGKRSLDSVNYHLKHLRGFFGMDRAVDITPDRCAPTRISGSRKALQTLRSTAKWQPWAGC
jgi:hypothetical protein